MQVLVNILLIVNVFVCIALVAVVLLQRSEGGALGMGGGGGSPSSFMTARGAGDLLTRVTWILAAMFFTLSIAQVVLSGRLHGSAGSIIDHINANSLDLASAPQSKSSAAPATPAAPSSSAPALKAPAPQAQTPAAPSPADQLSVFSAPTIQSKVLPAKPSAATPPADKK